MNLNPITAGCEPMDLPAQSSTNNPKKYKWLRLITAFLLSFMLLSSQDVVIKAQTSQKNVLKNFKYNVKNPLPKKHQEYLYKLCVQRGLDYYKVLAIIKTESNFKPNARSRESYGYFQIAKINHKSFAKTLKTKNAPLDPYVNLNWGTYELSKLYKYWKARGVSGDKLDNYVWSSYNKGLYGFKKKGLATSYIKIVRKNLNIVKKWY